MYIHGKNLGFVLDTNFYIGHKIYFQINLTLKRLNLLRNYKMKRSELITNSLFYI